LANQRAEYHKITGTVIYDHFTSEEINAHYRGDVQYLPEDDIHFPSLTVDQTLMFGAQMRAPQNHADVGYKKRKDYIDDMNDMLKTTFGLSHVSKMVVGDATLRGVSGGEKRRVSIAELLAGRGRITCWDK
jgi:ATP-binding cassette, subfamily G (WHITE), member 2, SNQ2